MKPRRQYRLADVDGIPAWSHLQEDIVQANFANVLDGKASSMQTITEDGRDALQEKTKRTAIQ